MTSLLASKMQLNPWNIFSLYMKGFLSNLIQKLNYYLSDCICHELTAANWRDSMSIHGGKKENSKLPTLRLLIFILDGNWKQYWTRKINQPFTCLNTPKCTRTLETWSGVRLGETADSCLRCSFFRLRITFTNACCFFPVYLQYSTFSNNIS